MSRAGGGRWLAGLVLAGGLATLAAAAPPGGTETAASQRDWLLRQVRLAEASGRHDLLHDALARLELVAGDHPPTLLAMLEVQFGRNDTAQARRLLDRLQGQGGAAAATARRLWEVHAGRDRETLRQARVLAARDQPAEALALYRRLFGDDPPGLQLGIEYWRLRGNAPEGRALAVSRLQALDRQYPDSPELLLLLAGLQLRTGQADAGLQTLHRLGRLDGQAARAAQREWRYLSGLPEEDRTVRLLEDFIARYPRWTRTDEARQRLAAVRRRVSDPAWRSARQGLELLAARRDAEAEAALRQALVARPEDPELLGGLATALVRLDRHAEAVPLFEQAARHATPEASTRWTRQAGSARLWARIGEARTAFGAGDLERAGTLYHEATLLDRGEPQAWLGLARVARARGEVEAALGHLETARGLAPSSREVLRELATLLPAHDPARLQALLPAFPADLRLAVEEDLARQALEEKRERFSRWREEGRREGLVELGRELRQALPGDPWIAHGLATVLRAEGQEAEADAVIRDMAARNPGNAVAGYAHALYLSAGDRAGEALLVMEALPDLLRTPAMDELVARLYRQQALDRARALRADGRLEEAIALLQDSPGHPDLQFLLAECLRQAGEPERAAAVYAQVLAQQPDDLRARLGQLEAWRALGDLERVRAGLADLPAVADGEEPGRLRQLAGLWQAVDEPRRVRPLLEAFVAAKTAPDPQAWRDLARLQRADDPAQALASYARGMVEAGLLPPADGGPRDDAALTRATREVPGEGWLERSLRRDTADLYRQRQSSLTLLHDSSRRGSGTPGLSRLSRQTTALHWEGPLAEGRGWARLERVDMDPGQLAVDAQGRHSRDFGSCGVVVELADGRMEPLGCTGGQHPRLDGGIGVAAGWTAADGRWQVDLGHNGSGQAVDNWSGGIGVAGDWAGLGWRLTLSRRPLTNSLLSQAGAVDPGTGLSWGGVTASGLTFNLGYDKGGPDGVWSSWSWHRLAGRNVEDNTRLRVMAGWYHHLVQEPDLRVDVGLSAMYGRHERDLGGYAFGQGGYYSPLWHASVGVPASLSWRGSDWTVRLEGAVGLARAHTRARAGLPGPEWAGVLWPDGGALDGAVVGIVPGALREATRTGSSHRLSATVERRLGGNWVLGTSATRQRSRDYAPDSVLVYLRHTLAPWWGDLPLVPTVPQPYGEFR